VIVPQNAAEARAALDILASPDALVAMAASAPAGGGQAAIRQAVADPVLGPHYVWLDAKQACTSRDPKATRRALELLDSSAVVLSAAERNKAQTWVDQLISKGGGGPTKAKGARGLAPADSLPQLAEKVRSRLG
jgi:hypothetical protein